VRARERESERVRVCVSVCVCGGVFVRVRACVCLCFVQPLLHKMPNTFTNVIVIDFWKVTLVSLT
jgi:hypothetical protein